MANMTTTDRSPLEMLSTPVQYLKGVGPQRAELLHRLGLKTVKDLLFYFPRDYQDLTDQRDIPQLEEGKLQSVLGVVEEVELRSRRSSGCVLGVLIRARGGHLRALWFDQPYMRDKFTVGQRVLVSGKPRYRGLVWEMAHPRVQTVEDEQPDSTAKILPVYPLTEGLEQWHLRRIIRTAVEQYAPVLEEVFPAEYRQAHDLWPIRQALPQVHFPDDRESLAKARRRFVYQELLILQLALAIKRQQTQLRQAPVLEATALIDSRIRRLFPFELTAAQNQAIAEIAADMGRAVPMNRLLQGDVGSGKTVVAVYAMLLAVAHRHQAALMAPTEVLARQHYLTLGKLLANSRVRLALLTGGLTGSQRRQLLEQIAAGQMDIVVGTQAVIQEDVQFARLGLVVIDEQHKFGVRQRATLKKAGPDPHYLVMTATPIPRTVALTQFGDFEISTLRQSPPGRQRVYTYLLGEADRERWWEFFRKKLRQGRQGYVVAPVIEESDTAEFASLEQVYESLANGPLEEFRLGLLHGRLSPPEKDAVMEDFRAGRIQTLVCTSVIEVGVDVPNATLMVIEGGQRFGLAQLHQLRGRISRGAFPGYCAVFANAESEEAQQRLQAFQSTTDGFQLAEIDFRLRGPGELFGARQHGMPPLRVADLLRDADVLEEARRDAQALVESDPGLAKPEHYLLRRMMLNRYGQALELADVG